MTEGTFHSAPGPDWYRNAVVGGFWSNDWAYARGYLEAANILVERALEQGLLDLLFYPICFLYRHSAEVTLKELSRDTERLIRILASLGEIRESPLDKDQLEKALMKSHGLMPLLQRLTERLSLVSEDNLAPEIISVIRDVDKLDPTGQGFRYSRKKDRGGSRPSFETQELYDVRDIGQRLQETLSFLADGVGSWLEEQIDTANDLLGEFNRDISNE